MRRLNVPLNPHSTTSTKSAIACLRQCGFESALPEPWLIVLNVKTAVELTFRQTDPNSSVFQSNCTDPRLRANRFRCAGEHAFLDAPFHCEMQDQMRLMRGFRCA